MIEPILTRLKNDLHITTFKGETYGTIEYGDAVLNIENWIRDYIKEATSSMDKQAYEKLLREIIKSQPIPDPTKN